MILPKEMRETYIERRRAELEQFKTNSKEFSFQFAKKVGHQIKGNAKNFDFEELLSVAKILEDSAESQDASTLALAINEYEKVLNLCADRLVLEKTVNN